MLFCLTSMNNSLNGYYQSDLNDQSIAASLPEGLELVYWDYYHTDAKAYSRKIEQHRQLGCSEPWVASGICKFFCA
jgi:hypothetical protein